jgi:hypothetical protein
MLHNIPVLNERVFCNNIVTVLPYRYFCKLHQTKLKKVLQYRVVHFFQFLGIKILDSELNPDPQLEKMLAPDPH